MSAPTFLVPAAPRPSLSELATLTGCEIAGARDLSVDIRGAASLDEADRGDLTFCDDPRLVHQLETTRATACFVAPPHRHRLPASCLALVTASPAHAFAQALAALFPRADKPGSSFGTAGANPGAIIHPEARLEPGVIVDPGAVIGPRAEIGAATIIGACSVVGPEVRIGRACAIGAQVTISHALVGNRVVLQPGARIGQDGFCFAGGPEGLVKVPHIGRVILQDDVEIGANTTIDRGTTSDTMIGEGTKIGNQVHIAAGVAIGRHCMIAAQAGLGHDACLGNDAEVGTKASLGPRATVATKGRVAAGATLQGLDGRM